MIGVQPLFDQKCSDPLFLDEQGHPCDDHLRVSGLARLAVATTQNGPNGLLMSIIAIFNSKSHRWYLSWVLHLFPLELLYWQWWALPMWIPVPLSKTNVITGAKKYCQLLALLHTKSMLTAVLVAASNFVGAPPSFTSISCPAVASALTNSDHYDYHQDYDQFDDKKCDRNHEDENCDDCDQLWYEDCSRWGGELRAHQFKIVMKVVKFESVFHVELFFSLVLCTLCIWYLYLLYFFASVCFWIFVFVAVAPPALTSSYSCWPNTQISISKLSFLVPITIFIIVFISHIS